MAFSKETIDFLFENRLHDSREWFAEHKSDYAERVTAPLAELVTAVAPTMMKIDSLIVCDPKRISRIYRDARYARDSVFRDEVWYTFARERSDAYSGHPGFYFSVGVRGISYGCGYYCADSAVRDAVRTLILSDDASFAAALAAYKGQRTFKMYGELYKRDKFPDESPEKRDWLNRKSYGVSFDTNAPEIMFSDGLARKVARDFMKISPLYDFYMKAEELALISRTGTRG